MTPENFPWGVICILGSGLCFTAYVIYYILRMAFEEMRDEQVPQQKIQQDSKTVQTESGERNV